MPETELLMPWLPNMAEVHQAVGCMGSPFRQMDEGYPILSYPLFAYSLSCSALEWALRNKASVRVLRFLAGCTLTEISSNERRFVSPLYLPLCVPVHWL